MSTFIFNDFSLHANEFSSNSIIKEVNLLIRFSHSSIRIALSALKAVLEKVDEYTVTVDNAELIDSELIITQETIINFYCGERILSYAYRDDKSGFIYLGCKTINRDDIIEGNKLKIKAESEKEIIRAKKPIHKATEVKKPEEPSKPTNEPEFVKAVENSKPKQKDTDMVKNMLKMRDYFEINRIITDNFDGFVDTSIVTLTEYLKSIRDVICKKVISQSGNSLLRNLSVEEIDKYIRPFSYLITLIDIEEPEKAAYMIKSGFNALLLAHMDARINGLDEDLHVDYTVK